MRLGTSTSYPSKEVSSYWCLLNKLSSILVNSTKKYVTRNLENFIHGSSFEETNQ